jgi:hypothetical protein
MFVYVVSFLHLLSSSLRFSSNGARESSLQCSLTSQSSMLLLLFRLIFGPLTPTCLLCSCTPFHWGYRTITAGPHTLLSSLTWAHTLHIPKPLFLGATRESVCVRSYPWWSQYLTGACPGLGEAPDVQRIDVEKNALFVGSEMLPGTASSLSWLPQMFTRVSEPHLLRNCHTSFLSCLAAPEQIHSVDLLGEAEFVFWSRHLEAFPWRPHCHTTSSSVKSKPVPQIPFPRDLRLPTLFFLCGSV